MEKSYDIIKKQPQYDDDTAIQLSGIPYKIIGSASDRSVFGEIKKYPIYETGVTNLIMNLLKSGNTFIDVGANIGYYLLYGAYLVGPSGKVIGFEPIPVNFVYCKKNLEINNIKNVEIYQIALWNKETSLSMVSPENFPGNSQISMNGNGILVKCLPLDSLKLHPNFIKIDIEGAEPFALQGMYNTICSNKPTIIIEMNRLALRNGFNIDADVYWEFFNEIDYSLKKINPDNTLIKINSLNDLKNFCPSDSYIDLLAEPN